MPTVHDTLCYNGIKEAVVVPHEVLQKKPRNYGTQGIYNILSNYLYNCKNCAYVCNNLLGKAFDNIGDVQNAEYYYQLSIKEKPDHLPVIINYSRFLVEQVRILHSIAK